MAVNAGNVPHRREKFETEDIVLLIIPWGKHVSIGEVLWGEHLYLI